MYIVHILKQLNDFNGVLSNVPLHFHLTELLEAALNLSKLRNQSHLRTEDSIFLVSSFSDNVLAEVSVIPGYFTLSNLQSRQRKDFLLPETLQSCEGSAANLSPLESSLVL